MRTRPLLLSLLLFAPLAASSVGGCAPPRPSILPEGSASAGSEGGESPLPGEGASSGDSSGAASGNPAGAAGDSSGVQADPGAAAAEAHKAARQAQITGVALTSLGAFSALMGGVFLGQGGGFCHSYDNSCGAAVGLPIAGALWIGAGVLPLVLGVTILVPKRADTSAQLSPERPADGEASPGRSSSSVQPAIVIGPTGAGFKLSF